MAAHKKAKKIFSRKFFAFLNVFYAQNPANPISQLFRFFQIIWKTVRNQKTGGSKELFLPKSDFQNRSTKFFLKKHPDFGGLETNQRLEIQT